MSASKPGSFPWRGLLKLLAMVLACAAVIGAFVPAVLVARLHAENQATLNNLGECAKAVHLAHDKFGKFPSYFGPYATKSESLTFHVHLLPFLNQRALYDNPVPDAIVHTYLSPMDQTQTKSGAGAANYVVNLRLFYTEGGLGSLSPQNKLIYPKMPLTFPDGMSATLLFATKYMHCGSNGGSFWSDPGNNSPESLTAATFGVSMALWQQHPTQGDCDPKAGTAVGLHVDKIHVAFADASVRSIALGVEPHTWAAAHTPGAGDVPGPAWEPR